ncbi:MAG TPA: hypothetical protein VK069_12110 [Mycolicibacillus parakoreensis]|nr:hypothetical protein [Mycolicibacillus parakoreensis]
MSTPTAPDRRRLLRHLLIVLIMVLVAYLVAVTVSMLVGDQQKQSEIDRVGGTRITWTPQTAGAATLSATDLNRAERVFTGRLKTLGIKNAEITSDDDTVVVTVPGDDAAALADLGQRRQLTVRPVLESLPTDVAPTEPPDERSDADRARQTTEPLLQQQELHLHAQHCHGDDPLAGRDDPALPLVTCSTDATEAYLLGPAVLDGEQIDRADTDAGPRDDTVVNLMLTREGRQTWSQYSNAHVGDAVAFTLDTRVISAAVVGEPIVRDAVQLPVRTTEQARRLTEAINGRALPVAFEATRTERVEPKAASSNFSSPEFGLIVGGFVLMIGLIGGLVFMMARERS